MTDTTDLVTFLRAWLDKDEEAQWHDQGCLLVLAGNDTFGEFEPCDCAVPARVLRDVEAKRRIVDELAPLLGYEPRDDQDNTEVMLSMIRSEHAEKLVRLLASVYDSHPDYRPEWKP
jgi:hypothetical protein